MLISITGSRCVTCTKYTQYYRKGYDGEFEAIDCGFCGLRQGRTRPGNRCGEYHEISNIQIPAWMIKQEMAKREAKT